MKRQKPEIEGSSAHLSHLLVTRHAVFSRILVLTFFPFGLLYLVSCSPSPTIVPRQEQLAGGKVSVFEYAKPETVGISTESLQRISNEIEQWVRDGDIAGAEWLIIKDRKIVMHEAVGWKDLEDDEAMMLNTIFRIKSMTKPIVGTCILMLAQEGKIRLSDRVSKYLKSFDNKKSREITIKNLLTHTGGFSKHKRFFIKYNSLKEAVDSIGRVGPQYSPGSHYQYSDWGYAVLGAVVAQVSGIPLEAFIQARILTPLGMTDTFCNLTRDDPKRKRVSSTYANTIFGLWKYWDNAQPQVMTYFRACAGIYSTPIDYAKFLLMWMDMGKFDSKQFLSPDLVRDAFVCTPFSEKEWDTDLGVIRTCYGMGWLIVCDRNNQFLGFGHTGYDGTLARAFPEEDTMVFYFTQSRAGFGPGYFKEFLHLLRANLHLY